MAGCVICGVPLGEGEEAQQPTLLNCQELRVGDKWEEQRNFRCFCKLVGLEEPREVGGLGEDVGEAKCCSGCSAALEEVARFEREIEELRLTQKALVEQLKGCLLEAVDEQCNGNIRKQLISCCLKDPPQAEVEPKTGMSLPTTEKVAVRTKDCFVRLERLSVPFSLVKENEEEVKGDKRAPRRSKTEALQASRQVTSRGHSSPSGSPEWNADYGGENNEESNSASSAHEDEGRGRNIPPTTKSTRKSLKGRGSGSKNIVRRCEALSKLSDTHVLYKLTPIRLAPREGLHCEEPLCHQLIVPETGTTFDVMARLGEIKEHVNRAHASHTEVYSQTQRPCPLCPDEGESRSGFQFRRHLLGGSHGKMPVLCTWCWRPIVNTQTMEKHAQSHAGQKETDLVAGTPSQEFECSTCGKKFGSKVNLNHHEKTHIPKELRKKQYVCDTCGVYLSSATVLKEHILRIHQPHCQKFRTCPICERKIAVRSLGQFKTHLRSHRNERPYVCDKCGQGFCDQQTLKRHLERVHTEERAFQCEFCDMRYKRPDSLRRHQKSAHPGQIAEESKPVVNWNQPADKRPDFIGPVRMFPCPVCEKLFPLRSRMTKHLAKSHLVS